MTMQITEVASASGVTMRHYDCMAGPNTATETELHGLNVLAFVVRGTFGYQVSGKTHEMAPGAMLIGRPGREFVCTHNHHQTGDACICFHFSDHALADEGFHSRLWDLPMLPMLPTTAVFGEIARARIGGHTDLGHDEIGLLLMAAASEAASGKLLSAPAASARDRRRSVDCALWISESYNEDVSIEDMASATGLSPFHFLRTFTRVIGITPHQYLVRARLRRAAGLLVETSISITDIAYSVGFGDLSNFVRTFGRAAGMSPRRFRKMVRKDSSFFQVLAASLP